MRCTSLEPFWNQTAMTHDLKPIRDDQDHAEALAG
jgi:hypothetical protein